MKKILCAAAIFMIHTPASAGGWTEPVYPPQPVCEPFLFWRICDVENPSPKREPEDKDRTYAKEEAPAPSKEPSDPRPGPEPKSEPAKPGPEPKPEPAKPGKPTDGGDKHPHKDKTKGKNHEHEHKHREEKK
jgi:hypothetical protein